MLHICIPSYNEAPTVGLLLWRIRRAFESYPREYAIVVVDDGSTDSTADTLRPYADVMPLVVLRHEHRRGYAAALDSLARAVVERTRYPRRDAMIVMQADFTDQPEHLPELVKRFEGGADVVVAERAMGEAPDPVRRLWRFAPWLVRPAVGVAGVRDPLGTFRLYRISVVREMLREAGGAPLVSWDGWAANAELLAHAARHARRIECVALPPRYDIRPRPTRVRALSAVMELFRYRRTARAGRPAPTAT